MKVLIISNGTAGVYGFRKELVSALIKENEVIIASRLSGYEQELKDMGCELIETEMERRSINPFKEFYLLNSYKRLLEKISPDIVLTYTIKPNVYGGLSCAKLGIPYVANITGLGTAVENSGILQKVTTFLYRQGLKKAQKVFFQNTENRDFMVSRKIISGAYDLLPGSGVNLEQYQVLNYPANDTIDFVFIARIMKQKGIDQYLDAARYIRKKYPQTRFHICGTCEQDYTTVLQQLQNDGTIIYHGRVKDIRKIHAISQCTIHPTYYPEGMSNVLLESCACGRPIITTDRAGCREIVEDGLNGFVVNQKDSRDLIKKIEKFLALSWEERRNMGLAGRVKVEKEFDRQIVVNKYMVELNKVEKTDK